jgi:hypothetical protein
MHKKIFQVTLMKYHKEMRQNGEDNARKKGICCLIFFTQANNLMLGSNTTTAKSELEISFLRSRNSKIN